MCISLVHVDQNLNIWPIKIVDLAANNSLFQPAPLPSRPAILTSLAGPSHAGSPNDMVPTMILACPAGLAGAGRSPFALSARDHSEKLEGKWENRTIAQTLSEKLGPKVRNLGQ